VRALSKWLEQRYFRSTGLLNQSKQGEGERGRPVRPSHPGAQTGRLGDAGPVQVLLGGGHGPSLGRLNRGASTTSGGLVLLASSPDGPNCDSFWII
jgi:hypothetical protein